MHQERLGHDGASCSICAPPLVAPSPQSADLSSMKCNAWTLRGHHKRGLHSHRAITMNGRKPEGGERWLAPLRKPSRKQVCSRVLMVGSAKRVNARTCSPGQALIMSAQRRTNQKYGSGYHTSRVWYTQPHCLSQIRAQPVEKLSVELFLLSKEKLNSWSGESSAKSYRLFLS